MSKPLKIFEPLGKRLNSTAGLIISLSTIFGLGYGSGKVLSDVQSRGQLNELNNKHTLELIELTNSHTREIIELQNSHTREVIELENKFNLLQVENEKRKK